MDGYIEEYQELRSEIRHYLDRRAKNVNFAFAITTVVVGLSEKIEEPYIFIIACLLSAFLWYDEIRRYIALQRVASYLELFIEPNVKGFNWETYGSQHSVQHSFLDRLLSDGVFPLTFIIHTYLTMIFAKLTTLETVVALIPFAILFLILVYLSFTKLRGCREKEIQEWKRISEKTA